MYPEQNQPKYKIHFNIPITILVIAQIIFIVLIGVSVSRLYQPDKITDEDPSRIPSVTISNLSSVVPENYSGFVKGIETTLFNLILRNSPDQDISTSINAVIREDSVDDIYFDDENVNYFGAVVDIPELEQSYWFYNEYSSSPNNQYIDYSKTYRIFCLEDSQGIIYPNFDCQDDFGLAGRYDLVSDLITYFDFNYFSPSYSTIDNSTEIKIYPGSFNIDDITKELYVQQTKDAVASLGVSPELFTYHVIEPEDINYIIDF